MECNNQNVTDVIADFLKVFVVKIGLFFIKGQKNIMKFGCNRNLL